MRMRQCKPSETPGIAFCLILSSLSICNCVIILHKHRAIRDVTRQIFLLISTLTETLQSHVYFMSLSHFWVSICSFQKLLFLWH